MVTARYEERTHGMTANAFVSVSLDPPLVLVSLDNRSYMHRILPRVRRYGISVLAENQQALSITLPGTLSRACDFTSRLARRFHYWKVRSRISWCR